MASPTIIICPECAEPFQNVDHRRKYCLDCRPPKDKKNHTSDNTPKDSSNTSHNKNNDNHDDIHQIMEHLSIAMQLLKVVVKKCK
tara:strand:+ start:1921 stop:2175 length:255 start_codon:yes stop_codon:yes gene_type:complete